MTGPSVGPGDSSVRTTGSSADTTLGSNVGQYRPLSVENGTQLSRGVVGELLGLDGKGQRGTPVNGIWDYSET